MTLRDAMVFIPDPGVTDTATAAADARASRHASRAERIAAKLQVAKRMRRLRKRAAMGAVSRIGSSIARQGGSAALGGVARAVASPTGLVVGALFVASIAALRLLTDQPFEKTGEQINQMLLGDLDDEARAKMATRDQLKGDEQLLRIINKENGINSQVGKIVDMMNEQNLATEVSKRKLREAFPVNGMVEQIVLRMQEAIKSDDTLMADLKSVANYIRSMAVTTRYLMPTWALIDEHVVRGR